MSSDKHPLIQNFAPASQYHWNYSCLEGLISSDEPGRLGDRATACYQGQSSACEGRANSSCEGFSSTDEVKPLLEQLVSATQGQYPSDQNAIRNYGQLDRTFGKMRKKVNQSCLEKLVSSDNAWRLGNDASRCLYTGTTGQGCGKVRTSSECSEFFQSDNDVYQLVKALTTAQGPSPSPGPGPAPGPLPVPGPSNPTLLYIRIGGAILTLLLVLALGWWLVKNNLKRLAKK